MSSDSGVEEGTLLFVYGADSGLFNALADTAHKVFAPHTYPCRLCALTHGYLGRHRAWQRFIDALPVACRFLHRDQLGTIPGIDRARLPAVYRWTQGAWRLCLSDVQLSQCRCLDELTSLLASLCCRDHRQR